MENENDANELSRLRCECAFLTDIIILLPAILFINEVECQGDVNSIRNTWSNQQGLDFIGYSKEQITLMGFDFFREIVHPADLGVFQRSLQQANYDESKLNIAGLVRVKAKGEKNYKKVYCWNTVKYTFTNGDPKSFLVIAVEFAKTMHANLQLMSLIKEMNKHIHNMPECKLSKQQKEVLRLITGGFTAPEIAFKLNISLYTAQTHRKNLMIKTGAKNTAMLVAYAIRSGEY